MMVDICFICHGNVNRSKAAEFIMKGLRPDLKIDSFAVGLKSQGGKLITKKMRGVLESNGIEYDITSRSKVLTPEDINNCYIIFAMDDNNLRHYRERFGDLGAEKLFLLPELIGNSRIKDPGFSKGVEGFVKAFEEIRMCCIELSKQL